MIQIRQYQPAMELACCWSGAFTAEECDKIREFGELHEFVKARIGESSIGNLNDHVRDTNIVWLTPSEEAAWVFKRMEELASYINYEKFGLDLTEFDGFQYSKYKIDGHYDWHIDTMLSPADGLFRKLSFVVMLTEPDEYEGGDFLLNDGGNQLNCRIMRPKKGDMMVFLSHVPHKVDKVTSGNRITLVTWAKGPKPV